MVAYRGRYAANLFVEEVAPSVGRYIAAKIDKRPKTGLRWGQEFLVCGAHRLPRAESDKVGRRGGGPTAKNKQPGQIEHPFWFYPTPGAPETGWLCCFCFSEVTWVW